MDASAILIPVSLSKNVLKKMLIIVLNVIYCYMCHTFFGGAKETEQMQHSAGACEKMYCTVSVCSVLKKDQH